MSIRNAILAAADHIERNSGTFNFMAGVVPHDCKSPGCAIGWVAHFAGSARLGYSEACTEIFGFHRHDFYRRLSDLTGDEGKLLGKWSKDAMTCALGLRLYADKFHAEPQDDARFWSRVDQSAGKDSCWPWTGYVGKQGYGRLKYRGSVTTAHRLAYTLRKGEIPKADKQGDVVVMHACDNRVCCNPAHLSIGDNAQNVRDAASKGAYIPAPETRNGERNSFAKLNSIQVSEIKGHLERGVSRQDLATHYNVSIHAIHAIASGRNWADVKPATNFPDWNALATGYVPGESQKVTLQARPVHQHEAPEAAFLEGAGEGRASASGGAS